MSLTTSEMTPADIRACTCGNDGNGSGWGGDWGAWIILFLIFGMFGWGGYGGFGGGFGGFGGGAGLQGMATRADINEGFALNNLQGGINAIQQGVCDSTYALNNAITSGFNNTNMGMMQGFNGVERGFCNLSSQLADCCCKNQTGQMQLGNQMERGFCDINYNAATNANSIIQNAHNDTDRILARIDAFERNQDKEKIAQQAAEIQAYRQNAAFGAMIDASRAEILRRTGAECPTAAYIVQPPTPVTFPTNCCGQATFGGNGCGNNCNSGCGF